MATSPLSIFRKYQYLALVALGVLAIISFVVLPPISEYLASTQRAGGPVSNEVVLRWAEGRVRESDLRNRMRSHVLAMNFLEAVARAATNAGGQPQIPYELRRDTSEQATVERMVLAEKARRLGVVISDDAIQDFIRKVSDGVLDHTQLNELLRTSTNRQLSRTALFNQLREELLAATMRMRNISGLPVAPPAVNWQHFKQLYETAVLEIIPLPVEDFIDDLAKEPTDGELRELYERYKDTYRNPNTPEPGFRRLDQIDFAYFVIDFDKLIEEEKAKITDEQVREEYEQGLRRGDFRRPQLPTPPNTSQNDGAASTETPAEQPASEEATESSTPEGDSPAPETPESEATEGDAPETEAPESAAADSETPASETPAAEEAESEAATEDDAPLGCDVQPEEQPEAEVTDEVTEAPASEPAEVPAEETPAEDAPADGEPVAEAPQAETADADASAEPTDTPQSEHRTLEEVRDQILRKLASPGAEQRRTEIKNELRRVLNEYFTQYTLWRNQERFNTGEKLEKPELPNYEELAQQFNVEFQRTGLVDVFQVQETELGQSSQINFTAGAIVPFVQLGFNPEIPLFQPQEIDSATGSREFLWWKAEVKKEFTPEFEEIRAEVMDAWQLLEARKLAQKAAEELEKQAAEAEGGTLAERLPEYADRVQRTNQFSWITSGNLGFQGMFSQPPRISNVDGVKGANHEFMQTVFGLEEGELGVVANTAQTEYYVIRVVERRPDLELLRERFLREYPLGGMQQTFPLMQGEQRNYYEQLFEEIYRELEVEWVRPPDQDLAAVDF